MKIPIHLETLGLDPGAQIKRKLIDSNLPECLGEMFLPIINYSPKIDVDKYFRRSKAVSEEHVVDINIDMLVSSEDKQYLEDKVLSKDAFEELTKDVYEDARRYSNQVIKCASCKHTDICFKLSYLYKEKLELIYNIE